jgi:DNA-binding MarR family transcriptional regulator
MEQILEKLFESVPKIKILRLFLRNPDLEFKFSDIVRSTQLKPAQAKNELKKLEKISFIRKKFAIVPEKARRISGKTKNDSAIKTVKKQVYFINRNFPVYEPLRELINAASKPSQAKLAEKIKKIGKIKLAVISGIFLDNENSRADILIVGDGLKRGWVEKILADVETEIGKALNYVIMDTDEFRYRMNMYDRFLRDILESPHQKLINKLNI